MNWFDGLLFPIMVAVAWIMVQFHNLLTWIGLDPAGGAAWGLSIVGLVIVMRIILIPLFVRQINAQRGLQLIQPEMQAIQKKYKGKSDPASREAMSRETMELYRKHGTNPFSSCLPILAQSPIFFALFRVLNSLVPLSTGDFSRPNIGPLTQDLAAQAESATIFGARLSGTFMQAGGDVNIQIVTVVLIVAMSLTTFTTQRQLTMKNMPPAALEGPMAQQQKMLLYLMPLIFAFSGVNFPIGVLIYWTTTNLWSMGQQFYTIRRMPAPGSAADKALKERQARKAAAHGHAPVEGGAPEIDEGPRGGQREQPKRKDRARRPPAQGASATPRDPGSASGGGERPKPAEAGGGAAAARKPRPVADAAPGQAARAKKPRPAAGGTPGQGARAAAGGSDQAARAKKPRPAAGGTPGQGARAAAGGSDQAARPRKARPAGPGSSNASNAAGGGRPVPRRSSDAAPSDVPAGAPHEHRPGDDAAPEIPEK